MCVETAVVSNLHGTFIIMNLAQNVLLVLSKCVIDHHASRVSHDSKNNMRDVLMKEIRGVPHEIYNTLLKTGSSPCQLGYVHASNSMANLYVTYTTSLFSTIW